MNARVPIYEGDGLLRDALARAAKPTPPEAAPVAPAEAVAEPDPLREDILDIERRARELRAKAIGDLFSRFFRAIEHSLWRAQQRDMEDYLAQATDNADLERRMRNLERSEFYGFYR
jgi:hypothetical protein